MNNGNQKSNNDEFKARQRRRYSNTDTTGLIVTPAKRKDTIANDEAALNVGIYARVSTDRAQQAC